MCFNIDFATDNTDDHWYTGDPIDPSDPMVHWSIRVNEEEMVQVQIWKIFSDYPFIRKTTEFFL